MCANVTIVVNDTAEDLQKFSVVLTAKDYRIEVKEYYVPVYIVDSNGQSFTETKNTQQNLIYGIILFIFMVPQLRKLVSTRLHIQYLKRMKMVKNLK